MAKSSSHFKKKIHKLYDENKYQEVDRELTDEILKTSNSVEFYLIKSLTSLNLENLTFALTYAQQAVIADPSQPHGYYARALYWGKIKEFDNAVDDYNYLIQSDSKNALYYYNRGTIWGEKNNHLKAIEDYTEAIKIDSKDATIYYNRGNSWYKIGENERAIEDFTKALVINPDFISCYNNRGNAFSDKGEIEKAIEDYSEAIKRNPKHANAHYNRADKYKNVGLLKEAIEDYQRYIILEDNPDDYFTKVAKDEIKQLNKKIQDIWYYEIDKIIKQIKKLLLFEEDCITHYTSMSAAKSMILDNSRFRLSEGTFLNDTSEGRELYKFLSFYTTLRKSNETIAEPFIERPFIGSFVADSKHDDLTLWRMYGKEDKSEAKGCAITIRRVDFLENIIDYITPSQAFDDNTIQQSGENFTFFKVAYRTKDEFVIPGASKAINKKLNDALGKLSSEIAQLNDEDRKAIIELLNDIAYLFKTAEYQYEHEVRLVVQGIGFKKIVEYRDYLPRVYIELVDIVPVLNKITLGPKVGGADEWAAAFNYKIKETSEPIEIVISHLPFK